MRMELTFENLVEAYERADVNNHFFIDAKGKEIIYIDGAGGRSNSEELIILENKCCIPIPERFPDNEISLIDGFSFELNNFAKADEIQQILKRKRSAFKEFKEFLNKYPGLKERWFQYKKNEIKNRAINWLCEAGVKLDDMPKPEIKITLLDGDAQEKLPEELKEFGPAACMNCGSEEGFDVKLFLLNTAIENALIDKEVKMIMKEKHCIEEYGIFSGGKSEAPASAKCRACGSENVMRDY